MNEDFLSSQVYDVISGAANTFFENLAGSKYCRVKESEVISGNYAVSGIQINFILREFMKPNGMPILPQCQIDLELLNAGSYFGMVEIKIPNENKFSIHAPHNKPENQVHLQKGREKIILPPFTSSIMNYGNLGSGLFLKFDTKEEAIRNIQKIRQKYI